MDYFKKLKDCKRAMDGVAMVLAAMLILYDGYMMAVCDLTNKLSLMDSANALLINLLGIIAMILAKAYATVLGDKMAIEAGVYEVPKPLFSNIPKQMGGIAMVNPFAPRMGMATGMGMGYGMGYGMRNNFDSYGKGIMDDYKKQGYEMPNAEAFEDFDNLDFSDFE